MTKAPAWAALAVILPATLAHQAMAAECRDDMFEGTAYAICEVDLRKDDLRLFLRGEDGDILGSFGAVSAAVEAEGKTLEFAMNAGMYHSDRRPVGLYVEQGQQAAPIVTGDGPGNFSLLPNGVLCIADASARVFETQRFVREDIECRDATQSGPMLVIDGELHPRFLPNSDSAYVRNGVGTSADGQRAVFAISGAPVNFHSFGRLFRDHLGLDQALYFDGNISRLYAPSLGRNDIGFAMGPIIGALGKSASGQ